MSSHDPKKRPSIYIELLIVTGAVIFAVTQLVLYFIG